MKDKIQNNKILKKALLTMLPASLACSFVDNFIFMIDTLLAGFTLGAEGIAAVAIGIPSYSVGLSLMGVIIKGANLQMTWKLGRDDRDAFNREFSGCMTFVLTAGTITTSVLFAFSGAVGALCGA